ncbi:hypothetical protein D3C72_913990 [compost metagenome]
MKALFAAATLAGLLATTSPALAADPSPSPKPMPIRGVTVDVQQNRENNLDGASHIEAPPFMSAPRQMRMAPAMEAAPAPAAKPRAKAGAPAPSPSPSPSPKTR